VNDNNTSDDSSTQQTSNPIEQLLSLLALVDPIEFASKAIDTSRRTTEALITVLENFASTVDNLNRTTTRINSLLDEVEEPLKRVMPQVGAAMNAMAAMGETAAQLGELSKRLGPLTTLAENAGGLFGFKPSRPGSTPSSSSQTE
jgi:ABC-type transporter Mla subunit MlaD